MNPEPDKHPEPSMARTTVCANCRKKVAADAKFCIYCGAAMRHAPTEPAQVNGVHRLLAGGVLTLVAGAALLLFSLLGWELVADDVATQPVVPASPAVMDATTVPVPITQSGSLAAADISATRSGDPILSAPTNTPPATATKAATATAAATATSSPSFGAALAGLLTPEPLPLSELSGLGYIVYVHYPGGGAPTEIYRINADGSGRTFISIGQSPGVSNDGAWIAYEDVQEAPDIYVTSYRGDIVRQITAGPAADMNPIWSPDGREIFFISDRGSGLDYVVSVETGEVRAERAPNWVSFTPTTGPYTDWTAGMCRIEHETGASRLSACLSRGDEEIDIVGDLIPRVATISSTDPWSPDGRFLVLDDGFSLYIFEVATGRYVQLPTEGRARDAHWAPFPEGAP